MHILVISIALATAAAHGGDAPVALRGHGEVVYAVAFSPDGSALASASFDGTVKLWRLADRGEIATLAGHAGKVLSIAFTPDGRHLLSGGEDKVLKLWALPATSPDIAYRHEGPAGVLLVAPDGKRIISGGDDRTIRIWDRAAGKEELRIADLDGPPSALAASADGVYLAAGLSTGTLRIWALSAPPPAPAPAAGGPVDLIRQGEMWRWKKGDSAPPADWMKPGFDDSGWTAGESGFGYSQDQRELAAVGTKLVDMLNRWLTLYVRKTFRVADPKAVEKLTLAVTCDDGFVAYLNGVEVGRDNVQGSPPAFDKAAAASIEAKETAIDLGPHIAKLAAGDNVLALQGHNGSRMSSDFILTPVLRAVLKPQAEAKPPAEGKAEAPPPPKPGSEVRRIALGEAPRALAFGPDGLQVASAGDAGAVRIHAVADGAEVMRLEGHGGAVRGVAFLPDGLLASASADGAVRIWSLSERKVVRSLAGHGGPVASLAVRPDRKLIASGGEDRTIRVWDPSAGKEVVSFMAHDGPVRCLAFSPDGKLLVSGSTDGSLRVHSAESGKPLGRLLALGEVRAVAAAADGHIFLEGAGSEVLHWRFGAPVVAKTLQGHWDMVHGVAVSPDGKLAASASAERTVRIWSLAEGKELRGMDAHGSCSYCVAFSPDGKTLASGGFDTKVKLWRVGDGAPLKTLEGHEEGIFSVAFTGDGGSVLSASSDGTIRKWGVSDGKEQLVFKGHTGWVSDLKVIPGKPRVLSADYEGNVILWSVEDGRRLGARKVPAVIHGLAVSPDGAWAAAACQSRVVLIFAAPGVEP